jgi:hypothetical protein
MDIYGIVKKLIGEIEPIGDSSVDEKRYDNLLEYCLLIERLLQDIKDVTYYKDKVEYSMSKSGKRANDFIDEIKAD